MAKILLLLIYLSTTAAQIYPLFTSTDPLNRNVDQNYRLQYVQDIISYDIVLNLPESIFTGNNTEYSGNVDIQFTSISSVDTIQLHYANIVVSDLILRNESIALTINNTAYSNTTQILTINLQNNLTVNDSYTLSINFTANVDTTEMKGFYRSAYTDEDGMLQYLLTTQFQPTYARNAFPCFDEPGIKSTFKLTIEHPNDTTALFNTAVNVSASEGSMSTTTFEISPYMSTYLVAFVVSKFTCTVGEPITNNITHSVCSNPDTHMDRQLANKNSAELMQSLENFTNILYNASGLTKMDQVAIPDFSAGAMENWGLVTYREMALLYNELESSVVDKQRILTIIAHEFAHMWFGNLVTCDWWNNLFLNEGFASFFEYFTPGSISSLIADNWEMDKQFIIDQQQNVFVADGLITSNALTFDATTPSDIWGKFSSISYLKGASILRMVENFMGAENFRDGVRRYLSEREFKTASPSHLWNALQESMPEGRLPLNVSLASVMKDWIDSAGYPLVTVHARGQNIYFTQKRFLYEGSSSTEWYIPITYTISNDTSKFSGVEPNRWLIPTHIAVIPGVLQTDQWIIINNQESAYYRVNYDEELWSRIISALSTNHTLIDVLNRAQIVDDSFNLARAGELTYPQCFNIIDYLRNEREYYPWASALAGFDFLLRVLGESSTAGIRLNNLQNELIKTIRNTVSFTVNASNHIETLKSRMILGRVCRLGEEECKNSASQLFRQFRNATSVDPNLRSIVYCNGLRYGNAEDFNFLWTQLELTKVASEHVTILAALGCTKIRDRIDYYLAQSVNETSVIRRQDISRVWTSVITSNPEGINYALDYLVNNANKISEYHSGTASLITSIAARITTTEQLNKLNELGNIADLSEPLASARKTVTDNMAWASNTRQQLDLHFRSAGSIAKFLPAMIFTLIFIVILS